MLHIPRDIWANLGVSGSIGRTFTTRHPDCYKKRNGRYLSPLTWILRDANEFFLTDLGNGISTASVRSVVFEITSDSCMYTNKVGTASTVLSIRCQ